MLAIKLKPIGKKHQKHYRLVVMEKKSKLAGSAVDNLGWVNPREKTAEIEKEKALEWIKRGAQPTASVTNLLIKKGILRGEKIAVHAKSKKKEATEAPQG